MTKIKRRILKTALVSGMGRNAGSVDSPHILTARGKIRRTATKIILYEVSGDHRNYVIFHRDSQILEEE